MTNVIFENIWWVIFSGIIGGIMIAIGSALDLAFMQTFGGFFVIIVLFFIVGIINEFR